MRLSALLIVFVCSQCCWSTGHAEPSNSTDAEEYVPIRRRHKIDTDSNKTESTLTESDLDYLQERDSLSFPPISASHKIIPLSSTTYPVTTTESSTLITVLLYSILIIIVGVTFGMLTMLFCCCWLEKRRVRRVTSELEDDVPLVTSHTTRRPLVLENHGDNENTPFTPPAACPVIIERNLPDPFTPINNAETPLIVNTEFQMTQTECGTPVDRNQRPFILVSTPEPNKLPELHIDSVDQK